MIYIPTSHEEKENAPWGLYGLPDGITQSQAFAAAKGW